MRSRNTDEQAIQDVVRIWLKASEAGDTEKLLALMTEDVVFLRAGHPPLRGRGEFAKTQAGMEGARIQAQGQIEEIEIAGDWAWMWTTLNVTFHPKGKDAGEAQDQKTGNTLTILQRVDGHWLIARDANLLAPPPSPQESSVTEGE